PHAISALPEPAHATEPRGVSSLHRAPRLPRAAARSAADPRAERRPNVWGRLLDRSLPEACDAHLTGPRAPLRRLLFRARRAPRAAVCAGARHPRRASREALSPGRLPEPRGSPGPHDPHGRQLPPWLGPPLLLRGPPRAPPPGGFHRREPPARQSCLCAPLAGRDVPHRGALSRGLPRALGA